MPLQHFLQHLERLMACGRRKKAETLENLVHEITDLEDKFTIPALKLWSGVVFCL